MKRILAVALVLLALLPTAALADTRISVQGQGAVSVSPDLALISVGVQETGEDVAAIQAAVNEKTNAVIDALIAEGGMAEEDIRTENYAIYRDYGYDYDDRSQPVRYTASCMLRLTLRDVNRSGEIIDLAFAHGANALNNISFSVADDGGALADRALALAVADGIHRAQVIAEAAGINLPAAPTQVTEGQGGYYGEFRAAANDEAFLKSATRLMSGMVQISAAVTVTYIIDD